MKFLCEGVQKLSHEQTDRQTDRYDWKHYQPAYAGGNECKIDNIGNIGKSIHKVPSVIFSKIYFNIKTERHRQRLAKANLALAQYILHNIFKTSKTTNYSGRCPTTTLWHLYLPHVQETLKY